MKQRIYAAKCTKSKATFIGIKNEFEFIGNLERANVYESRNMSSIRNYNAKWPDTIKVTKYNEIMEETIQKQVMNACC